MTTGCKQVRNEQSSHTGFSALRRGERSKEVPVLGFFSQTVPPSSARSKRRKEVPSGGVDTPPHRTAPSARGRCITALQAKARGSSASERVREGGRDGEGETERE